jgi:membrane-associated phospholipid phosphatase
MDALQQFGISLIQVLQTLSPSLDGVMNFFTFLGRVEFYLLVIPFIYWSIDKRLGIRTILVLLAVDIAGTAFKLLFHQPRPYWIKDLQPLSEETSYGIPSTHASDSMAVGGYLAYRARKAWLWVVMGITIFFIGLSRLYLGVHFLHDVVFGWAIGVLVLWFAIRPSNQITAWARSKTLSTQIGIGFAASVTVILLVILLRSIIAGTPDPVSWSSYATGARSITHAFTLAGTLFGAFAGYALMRQYARFQNAETWGKRALSYLIGIIGLLALYFGLDMAFSTITADETTLGYLLRYVRYTLTNLWLTFGAPWIFLKVGLAQLELQSNARKASLNLNVESS